MVKKLSQENEKSKKMAFHQNILPHYCHEGKKAYISNFFKLKRGVDWGTAKVSPLKALLRISTVCVCL